MKRTNFKSFKMRMKKYSDRKKSLSDYITEEYFAENGIATIDIDLSRIESLYDPMSMGKQRELNGDIYEFLDRKAYPIPSEMPVTVRVHGIASEDDRKSIKEMLREHYDFQADDKRLDLKLNRRRSRIMYVVGVFMLAVYFALSVTDINTVFYEVLSIAATFIVWEAVDISVLERHALKVAYHETMQMALAEIEFTD